MLNIGDGSTSPGSLPGNVVVSSATAGALTFNTPAGMSVTASGNISGNGSGGLTKSGAGLAVLSGSNSYTGATTVSGGSLQLGNGTNDPAMATGGVAVAGNAALVYNVAASQTASYAVSSSGYLVKAGPGAVRRLPTRLHSTASTTTSIPRVGWSPTKARINVGPGGSLTNLSEYRPGRHVRSTATINMSGGTVAVPGG